MPSSSGPVIRDLRRATRLPNDSMPYTSTIVFVVRRGDPKGIEDRNDVSKPDVKVIGAPPAGLTGNAGALWGKMTRVVCPLMDSDPG